MLAMITNDGTPITYVRGSKQHVVNRAKELIVKLNKRETDGIPSTLIKMYKDNPKFLFRIIHSIEELS